MLRFSFLPAAAAALLLTPRLHSQSPDPSLAQRRCNKRLADLRMPLLNDLGDSAHIVEILSRGGNPRTPMTWVKLRFGKDGSLRNIDVQKAASSKARDDIRDSLRSFVHPIGPSPVDFTLHLLRFNETGQIRVLTETTTCPPEAHSTAEMQNLISRIRQQAPETNVHRVVVVLFVLEANGRVADAWVEFSGGSPQVDELAVDVLRAQRFEPAIVGHTAVAALVRQSVKF